MSISITVDKPTIDTAVPSYVPAGGDMPITITELVISYMHTISAFGGFDSASIVLAAPQIEAEAWLGRLGHHVVAVSPALEVVWAGFINAITITSGSMSLTKGPLTDTGNRIEIVYSTVDTSTDPPTVGVRTRTAVADDTSAQGYYGIIHKVLSVGGTTDVDAVQIRDTWLADNALPGTAHNYATGGTPTTISLECLGYSHWLKLYPYNQTTTTGTMDLDAKIQAVLGADPNGMFSTDYGEIVANTLPVKQWEDTDSTAWAVIQALTAMGDAASNRHLFGVYENQRAYYTAAPTDLAYVQQIAHEEQRVMTTEGTLVEPWDVRPGRWLMYTDFLTGGLETDTVPSRDDDRFEFIESVTYIPPGDVQHSGGKISTLPQMLARLGLGGMAA
jgi:hypothetical protein